MALIHPTAIIDRDCELADDVQVGPYSIIRNRCIIGSRTVIDAHVMLEYTTIGEDCQVHFGAALGAPPQDLHYRGEETRVVIGDRNIIREQVTVHRASGEGNVTSVGNDCMLMAVIHLAHNCQVGNHVMIATLSGMSGHTILEDRVIIGGMVGSHQFVRVGKMSMVSGYSKLSQDVPPFSLVDGKPARVIGPNIVGLRRAGFEPEVRQAIQRAFRLIYRSDLDLSHALEQVNAELADYAEVRYLVDFLERMRNGRVGRQQEAVS